MKLFLCLILATLCSTSLFAQNGNNRTQSLRVYLDCQAFCDQRYAKEEFPVVDFLNERSQADVHILQTRERTASDGDLVTLTFIGQRSYSALTDTLSYSNSGDATRDDERRAFLHHMSIGLSRYLARAGLSDKIIITAIKPTVQQGNVASIEEDPWDYWVFSIGGSGSLNGQATTQFTQRRINLSANRTTNALKIRFSGNANDSQSEFDTGDEKIRSTTHSESLFGQLVKSIGEKWSIGGSARVFASSFQNTKLEMQIGPAIEYDIFPYSESTRKLLTIQYNIRITRRHYDELTIFARDEETILRHSLEVQLSLSQKWGSLNLSTSMNHMLTNFDRSLTESYNVGVNANANVRLFRGLSFNTFFNYNRIRDQIDLPSDAATKEEILLRSVQLPTGYSYFVNFGFTYRFGSIFNSVVNPRM